MRVGWKLTARWGKVTGMSDLTAVPAGIDAHDWANTPETIRVRFVALGEEHAGAAPSVRSIVARARRERR